MSPSDMHAFDVLSCPVWLFATDTLHIIASNSAAQEWLGYDAPTLHKLTIADLRPAQDRARLAERVRTFDGTDPDAGCWTILSKSGKRFKASLGWRKVWFKGTEAIVASIRNMTRIEQTSMPPAKMQSLQDAMLLSQDHAASLINTLPENLLVLTPDDHVIVALTDEYARAMMIERGSVLGRRLVEVFPDYPCKGAAGGVQHLQDSLQRVSALRVTDVMNVQRRKTPGPDGTFQDRLWMMRNSPVFDPSGQLIYIIHRAKDVTEFTADASGCAGGQERIALGDALQDADARTTMLALQERETRLRTAETLLGIGSWEYDFQQGTLFWSKRVFEIYGVSPDQPAPDFDAYIALVHPDDQQQMLANYKHFIASGAPTIVFHHRAKRPDGTIAHIRGVGARQHYEGRAIIIGHVQDVTSYKEAEERLRDAARLQKLAGDVARLGCWRVDLDPPRITWSPETAAIHDEREDATISLEEAMAYYIPEHRARITARFTDCFQHGQSFDEVLQIITAKGRRIWVRAIGEPARNDAGKVVAVEGAFQDVSELVAARDASDELSRRLRQTLESISDAFILLDDQWRFSFLNRQAEILLKHGREDLLGAVIWQKFPEALGTAFQTEYEYAVSNNCTVQFKEFYPALKSWFEVEATPTPEGLAVYFRDVTHERAKEEQLRLLESAVSRQNDILLITEAEPVNDTGLPRIVFVNDAFEKRTGFSRADVIGQTASILQGPKTQPAEIERIRQAIGSLRPVCAELIYHTKSGDEFWLELDIMPLADDAGKFTHWVAIGRDITERKRSQQSIRLNEERFRLIAKATGHAVWEWDIANDRQWWSEGLSEIFGHQPDATDTSPTLWRRHIHAQDKARVNMALGRLLSGEQAVLREQYRFLRADGSCAIVEDCAFVLRDTGGGLPAYWAR